MLLTVGVSVQRWFGYWVESMFLLHCLLLSSGSMYQTKSLLFGGVYLSLPVSP
jgi:hypothetical protein